MSNDTTRGLESPARRRESTDELTCDCGATIDGVEAVSPGTHKFSPCGCRVTTCTVSDLAGEAVDRGRGVATDGGTSKDVTAEWLEGRYFCYPIECASCGEVLADAEENGAIGRGDAFTIDADGRAICPDHTNEIHFIAAGTYAYGGGTPCETGRSFRPEDVIVVCSTDGEADQPVTDGGVATVEDSYGTPAPAEVDSADLKHDGCPICAGRTFTESPAGYYHCDHCQTTWAGDSEDASLMTYFGPSPSDLAAKGQTLPIDIGARCQACFVEPRLNDSQFCAGCAEALLTDGGEPATESRDNAGVFSRQPSDGSERDEDEDRKRATDHNGPADDPERVPTVFETLDARSLRIKVGCHHDPTDPIAAALDTDDDDDRERALRLVDGDGDPIAVVALDDDCGLWGLADRDDGGTVEGPVDRDNVQTALARAETVRVVPRDATRLTGEMQHPEFENGDAR